MRDPGTVWTGAGGFEELTPHLSIRQDGGRSGGGAVASGIAAETLIVDFTEIKQELNLIHFNLMTLSGVLLHVKLIKNLLM